MLWSKLALSILEEADIQVNSKGLTAVLTQKHLRDIRAHCAADLLWDISKKIFQKVCVVVR